ncbi:hypothetical protein CHM34_02950 [Paludifilum halophilum]|uniref:DoxX family protein n=2 Tax=Paludifilum halophilum TaxID=1642702 RepID=A0A235BA17_9BACL|nr:hypothetical protein CHM34_02950 [Paludifilum halophilum]
MAVACRVLLGLIFLAAGANGLLVVFKLTPVLPTSPKAMEFFKLEYLLILEKVSEFICGILLITNRFVPLSLSVLAPIIVNILGFHLFEDPKMLPLALLLIVLEAYLVWVYRRHFAGILTSKAKMTEDA